MKVRNNSTAAFTVHIKGVPYSWVPNQVVDIDDRLEAAVKKTLLNYPDLEILYDSVKDEEQDTAIGEGGGGEGSGLPPGGSPGQLLTKVSSDDGDAAWVDPPTAEGATPFEATVSDSDYQDLFEVAIPVDNVAQFKVEALARQNDGAHKARLFRTGLFANEAGTVIPEVGDPENDPDWWDDSITVRSSQDLDLRFLPSGDKVKVQAHNVGANPTKWAGTYKMELVN